MKRSGPTKSLTVVDLLQRDDRVIGQAFLRALVKQKRLGRDRANLRLRLRGRHGGRNLVWKHDATAWKLQCSKAQTTTDSSSLACDTKCQRMLVTRDN